VDAEGLDLVAERLGQALERELRRAVGAEARRGHLAADARHLHDRAAALLPHGRQDQARERCRPEEVEVEERAQLLVGRLLDGDLRAAGVVHEHVDATEAVERDCHGGLAVRWVGHVEANRVDALGFAELGKPVGAPRRRHDGVAALQCRFRDGAAEAARRSCDEPDPCVAHASKSRDAPAHQGRLSRRFGLVDDGLARRPVQRPVSASYSTAQNSK
jgi:hypothetical protein